MCTARDRYRLTFATLRAARVHRPAEVARRIVLNERDDFDMSPYTVKVEQWPVGRIAATIEQLGRTPPPADWTREMVVAACAYGVRRMVELEQRALEDIANDPVADRHGRHTINGPRHVVCRRRARFLLHWLKCYRTGRELPVPALYMDPPWMSHAVAERAKAAGLNDLLVSRRGPAIELLRDAMEGA